MRYILVFLIAIFANTPLFAQIKIEGEHNATVGYMLKLKLSQLDVSDPQIKCFPDNPDWLATKDFAGQAWIIYVPGKKSIPAGQKSQLYTFVIAGSKTNKTYLETFEVIVRSDDDEIVPPKPVDTQLQKDLLAVYKVAPDAIAKAKLLAVYSTFLKEIKDNKFLSNREAALSLSGATQSTMKNALSGVRDVVAAYLEANLGRQAVAYDKEKLIVTVQAVIDALSKVPD